VTAPVCPECGLALPWTQHPEDKHTVGGVFCQARRNTREAIANGLVRPRTRAPHEAGLTVQYRTSSSPHVLHLDGPGPYSAPHWQRWTERWIATYDEYLRASAGVTLGQRARQLRLAAADPAESERVQAFLVLAGFSIDPERLV